MNAFNASQHSHKIKKKLENIQKEHHDKFNFYKYTVELI